MRFGRFVGMSRRCGRSCSRNFESVNRNAMQCTLIARNSPPLAHPDSGDQSSSDNIKNPDSSTTSPPFPFAAFVGLGGSALARCDPD